MYAFIYVCINVCIMQSCVVYYILYNYVFFFYDYQFLKFNNKLDTILLSAIVLGQHEKK